MTKPRIVKNYEKLDQAILEQIKLTYPYGFEGYLSSFTDQHGKKFSALPFETEDKYYLVRMTEAIARELIEVDDDYDDYGNLRVEVKEEYEERYEDFE